ncbi:MAG: SpoIIE family protein phosphatase [Bacteroidales bacterium]|nr:SpoIIE family protein phosphatase [Bacteroidales bacterium]
MTQLPMTLRAHIVLYSLVLLLSLATMFSCAPGNNSAPKLSPDDTQKLADLHKQALTAPTLADQKLFANQEQGLAHALRADKEEIRALLLLHELHYNTGDNEEAVKYAMQAYNIADSLLLPIQTAQSAHALGNALGRYKNNPIATKNFARAFLIYLDMHDTINVIKVWHDLIPAYLHANIIDSALITCQRCRRFNGLSKNYESMATSYALSGMAHLAIFRSDLFEAKQKNLDSAYTYLKQAAALNKKYNNPQTNEIIATGLVETLYNLAVKAKDANIKQKLGDSSLIYLPTAIKVAKRTGDKDFIHRINILGLKAHYISSHKEKTDAYVDSLAAVAKLTQNEADYVTSYRALSILSAYKQDYENAFNYRILSEKYREILNAKDASFNLPLLIAKTQTEREKQRAAHREASLKQKAQKQTTITIVVTTMLTMLMVIAGLIFHYYKRSKKLNAKINAINEEMRVQSEEIKIKSEEIMDGLTYASIIQFAAMPSANEMKRIFGDNLAYLTARNIVSGDFFWASEDASSRYKLLAVGDCTGHGVPGALLSMLGMSILDYTTRHFGTGEISAGIVLDKMRNNFKRTLNQTSFRTDKTIDSIDIALLVFDTHDKIMHYAAAFRPLLLFRFGEFMRMKADSMPIGIYPREKPHFTDNEMKISKGDIIYLYTDGFVDQDGYEDAAAQYPRAYSSKRFFKLLKNIFTLPFDQQEEIIKEDMDQWCLAKSSTQTDCIKTDDATIVGIAVNNFINFDV